MKKLVILFLLNFFSFLFITNFAFAIGSTTPNAYSSFLNGINSVGTKAGISQTSVTEIILSVIQILIGITGTIFLVIIVYAGIQWMFSAGDSGKIKKSINLMKNAAIGLSIVAFSYAIVEFVINNLIAVAN
ncbi:hypothetical protein EOM09_00025 [bacterium]|nr:hypothetical protein [bacterium]